MADERLRQYRYIGRVEAQDALALAMTGTALSEPVVSNRSRYHFDPAVFRDPQLLEFLADANRHDEALYRRVCEGAAPLSPMLRSGLVVEWMAKEAPGPDPADRGDNHD